MPSTFFGLDIAYTGVLAANASVNTTAHNIANVETKGYTRQETVQTAGLALKVAQSYGMVGTGAATHGIDQVRNEYYDIKYREAQTNLGQYEIKQYYMKQIEDYYTDKDTMEGFDPIFSKVFNALEEVYKQAGTDSVKTQFLGTAQDLCTYFNAQAVSLEKLQLSINEEIRNRVDEINSIASQISTLNKQINTIEVTGNRANDLRDKRNLLVDELAKICDVEVRETPIYTTPGGTEKSGIYNYEVTIAGGQQLVMGYDYFTLTYKARNAAEKVNQSDADGLYDVMWSSGMEFNVYGGNLGGELKGLIELRDGNNEEYFHGQTESIVPAGTDANGKPQYTVKIKVEDKDYLTDMNKCTLPEKGQLTLVTSKYNYTAWSYDATTHEYTFTISQTDDAADLSNAAARANLEGRTSQVGRKINCMGIPYYQEQMNEWVRVFATAMNDTELNAQDANGDPAEVIFIAKDITDGNNPYKFTDHESNQTLYTSTKNDYYKLTAATFSVNNEMLKDVSKFGTTYDINQGVDAQDITEQLLTVSHDKTKATFRGCSTREFLQCLTTDISLGTNTATTFTENYTNVSKAVNQQRMSISGVDNDEEALNLVRFQEAYNLSAKVMQVMTEIYDRLILNTGV